jgi:hypothetical protein
MKSSLSWSVIPSVEQSPTPHSAPRRQYLSWICLWFLQIDPWIQCKSVATKMYPERTDYLQECKQAKILYFSLFFLDLSSSSCSTLEFLNLLSNSAYFFWFSAGGRKQWRVSGFQYIIWSMVFAL